MPTAWSKRRTDRWSDFRSPPDRQFPTLGQLLWQTCWCRAQLHSVTTATVGACARGARLTLSFLVAGNVGLDDDTIRFWSHKEATTV